MSPLDIDIMRAKMAIILDNLKALEPINEMSRDEYLRLPGDVLDWLDLSFLRAWKGSGKIQPPSERIPSERPVLRKNRSLARQISVFPGIENFGLASFQIPIIPGDHGEIMGDGRRRD